MRSWPIQDAKAQTVNLVKDYLVENGLHATNPDLANAVQSKVPCHGPADDV